MARPTPQPRLTSLTLHRLIQITSFQRPSFTGSQFTSSTRHLGPSLTTCGSLERGSDGNTTGVTTVNRNMIWMNWVLLSWLSSRKVVLDQILKWTGEGTWELVKAVGSCLGVGSIPFFPAFQWGGAWERRWVGAHSHSHPICYTAFITATAIVACHPRSNLKNKSNSRVCPNSNMLGLQLASSEFFSEQSFAKVVIPSWTIQRSSETFLSS